MNGSLSTLQSTIHIHSESISRNYLTKKLIFIQSQDDATENYDADIIRVNLPQSDFARE